MSTARAFLNPIRRRRNLHIGKMSEVTKIEFDKHHRLATGVEFIRDGKTYSVGASKEVIVCAGTINTPKLLMLSGIGPKNHLESVNISVIIDLPVGENLQDHVGIPLRFRVNDSSLVVHDEDVYTTNSIDQYAKYGNGPLSYNRLEAVGFVNAFKGNKYPPNIEFLMGSNAYNFDPRIKSRKEILAVATVLVRPRSRGTIKLASNDPKSPPLIDANYLHEEQDRILIAKGLDIAIEIMQTPTMKKYDAQLDSTFSPACRNDVKDVKKFLRCLTTEITVSGYHAVATAKMGPKYDRSSVVSSQLLVHGLDNLRVIDASVMPVVPRGNTNAPTMMVAEKGSDIIKERYNRDYSEGRWDREFKFASQFVPFL